MDDWDKIDEFGRETDGTPLEVLKKVAYARIGSTPAGGRVVLREDPSNLKDFLDALVISSVTKRGNATQGEHQELMCIAHSGIRVRISRNNSSDTFQIGADERPMGSDLEIVAPPGPLSGRQLYRYFKAVHKEIPRYANGDCQAFANRILAKVKGQKSTEQLDAEILGM